MLWCGLLPSGQASPEASNGARSAARRCVLHPVTVGKGIAPPVSASEPCLSVSTSHGSSVIRPLSWAPLRACDLHVGASPARVIHPSLDGVRTASAALLVPITGLSPSPRQPLRWLAPRPSLRGESYPVAPLVDTASSLSAIRGDAVPHRRVSLQGGPHASPGVSGVYPGRLQTRPALIRALWPQPIIRVGVSPLTTMPPWMRVPVRVQLRATGFPVGCRVTAVDPRAADGWSVATAGDMPSPRHRRGRHGTCTAMKWSTITCSQLRIPYRPGEAIVSRKRIAPPACG